MTKKCLGCGIVLQDSFIDKDGYTPKITNDLCQRCFRLKNYGEKKNSNIIINNDMLIDSIKKKNAFVIFVVDFLNIYNSIIDLYKKINGNKILVITKSDVIPSNIIKDKVIDNIKRIYNINDDIYLTSIYDNYNINVLKNIIDKQNKVLFAGFTNAGKSSLINKLIDSNLTVSRKSNTTLDFVKLKYNNTTIFDSPGFIDNYFYDEHKFNKRIKARTYQLKNKYYLSFNDIKLSSDIDNNLTFYINNNIVINKRKRNDDILDSIKVKNNSDLIIKGIGFINIKKECNVFINIDKELYEIRSSIVGGNHE